VYWHGKNEPENEENEEKVPEDKNMKAVPV